MPALTPPTKLSRSYSFVSVAGLALGALVSLVAAWAAVKWIEHSSKSVVEHALFLESQDWATVETNGLQVFLSGTAPSETARFAALTAAGHEVDGARVIDRMEVPDAQSITPPTFSIEALRNQSGISLIGLVPQETDREALALGMKKIDPLHPMADLLETAAYPAPEGWSAAVDFTVFALTMLPRSKISMDADHVAIEAIADSAEQKTDWEQKLRARAPGGVRIALDISAPRPVITPFTLRFIVDSAGARFDACTAHTPAGRNTIISAGIAAGVKGAVDCTIALGVPSPDWPDAVARAIAAVRDMGGGALTFSDADVTLVAPEGTPQDTYDRVLGELEADLPEVFSLHGVLPVAESGAAATAGPPEFTASLDSAGKVQLRGRVATEQDRTIVESFARARFGTGKVYAPLTLDQTLPAGWSVRTLAGLEALDYLADGKVTVKPSIVTVTGKTGDTHASAEISRVLSGKLGEAEDFRVNVTYEEALDPVAAMPTPEECVADINAVLAKAKITFAPGSAEIELASASTVDAIAAIVKSCPDVAMEIGGYTDSQGREEMNQTLSQRRAEAVLSALLARRVLTSNLAAFGYGEDFPIADNDTEDGREANRRIEFRLVGAVPMRTADASGTDPVPAIRPAARPGETGDAAETDAETGPVQPETAEAAAAATPDTEAAAPDEAEAGTEAEATAATEDQSGAVDGTDAPEPDMPADQPEAGDEAPVPGADAPAAENDNPVATDPVAGTDTPASADASAGADPVVPAPDAAPGFAIPGTEAPETPAPPEAGAVPDQPATDGAATAEPPASSAVTSVGVAEPEAEATAATAEAVVSPAGTGDEAPIEATAAPEPVDANPDPIPVADAQAPEAPADPEAAPDVEATGTEAAVAAEPDAAANADAGTESVAAETEAVPTDAVDDPEAEAVPASPSSPPRARPEHIRNALPPPVVVDPDLAGIRPRPRPDDLAAAPQTE